MAKLLLTESELRKYIRGVIKEALESGVDKGEEKRRKKEAELARKKAEDEAEAKFRAEQDEYNRQKGIEKHKADMRRRQVSKEDQEQIEDIRAMLLGVGNDTDKDGNQNGVHRFAGNEKDDPYTEKLLAMSPEERDRFYEKVKLYYERKKKENQEKAAKKNNDFTFVEKEQSKDDLISSIKMYKRNLAKQQKGSYPYKQYERDIAKMERELSRKYGVDPSTI